MRSSKGTGSMPWFDPLIRMNARPGLGCRLWSTGHPSALSCRRCAALMRVSRSMDCSLLSPSWSFSTPITVRVGNNTRLAFPTPGTSRTPRGECRRRMLERATRAPRWNSGHAHSRSQCRLSCVQGMQDAGRDSWVQRRAGAALLIELAQDAERLWCASQAGITWSGYPCDAPTRAPYDGSPCTAAWPLHLRMKRSTATLAGSALRRTSRSEAPPAASKATEARSSRTRSAASDRYSVPRGAATTVAQLQRAGGRA
jgi:hypothetical protein